MPMCPRSQHNGLVGGSSPAEPTTQSFEPEDFPETAEKPAIGGLLRLRFSLRGDRFWPECDFGRLSLGRGYRFPDATAVVKASVPISLVGLDKRGRLNFRTGHGDPLGHHGD